MNEDRLNSLAVLNIVGSNKKVDIIEDFAKKQSRKNL